jgi:hypothetical protein
MRSLTCLLLALLAPATPVFAASASARRDTYVGTLGHDTLSLEQVVRRPDSILGDWISLYGWAMVHHYEMTLRPDGTVRRYRLTLHRLRGKVDGGVDLGFDGDSVIVRAAAGDEARCSRLLQIQHTSGTRPRSERGRVQVS